MTANFFIVLSLIIGIVLGLSLLIFSLLSRKKLPLGMLIPFVLLGALMVVSCALMIVGVLAK